MRQQPVAAALVAMLCGGCATGRELRVHAERGAPLVPRAVAKELGPATGYMLVNPVVCLELLRGGSGGDGYGAVLVLAAMVGCAGFLGAVDLVALPVQAVRRRDQVRDLEAIGLACPLADPASRVAPDLAARMVAEFGFTQAPQAAQDAPVAEGLARRVAARAVLLRVKTNKYERSSRVTWEGLLQFRGPDDELLWERGCSGETPKREASTFEGECEAARGEIAVLANECVESIMLELRERWPKWAPEHASAATWGDDPPDGR